MAVDYDLVVIGSSWAGIYAAKSACQLQARVALVTQTEKLYLPNDLLLNQSLGELGRWNYRQQNSFLGNAENVIRLKEKEVVNWIRNIETDVQNLNSLAHLSALGVDVIVGRGEFYRLPKLGFKVKQRDLRSRNFLLATGTIERPKFTEDRDCQNYFTPKDLQAKQLASLPDKLLVVGSEPTALELAQGLVRLGKQITLVCGRSRILPQEDLDINNLIRAQLEAEGIKLFTDAKVSQIKAIDGQKWLQVNERALSADAIIVAGYGQPNITGLNLAGVGVKYDEKKVFVNRKLQTTNPIIYACGDLIGGYNLANITRYEINLILKNTLFFNRYKTNYHLVPWAIYTQPNLARVGLNEFQAKRQGLQDFLVIKQYFNTVEQAQVLDRTAGFCKLLVEKNGAIIGCSIVGDRSSELIGLPALMMQQQIKLDRNPMRGMTALSLPAIYPSMAEIITQASHNFYEQKIQQNTRLLNRLRTWFSKRKN